MKQLITRHFAFPLDQDIVTFDRVRISKNVESITVRYSNGWTGRYLVDDTYYDICNIHFKRTY